MDKNTQKTDTVIRLLNPNSRVITKDNFGGAGDVVSF